MRLLALFPAPGAQVIRDGSCSNVSIPAARLARAGREGCARAPMAGC